MGITRDPSTKRRATGGKRAAWRKKRKFSLGRPSAMTKLGPKRIHTVRVRGGNLKFRALRLDSGNFSWGSESKFFFYFKPLLFFWNLEKKKDGKLEKKNKLTTIKSY